MSRVSSFGDQARSRRDALPACESRGVAYVNSELRKVIFGFDLAVLIGNGDRATLARLRDN